MADYENIDHENAISLVDGRFFIDPHALLECLKFSIFGSFLFFLSL